MIDTATETRCKNPKCGKPVHQTPGPHRPKEYCNDTCKEIAYRLRKKGITDGSVTVVDESTQKRIAELEQELARYRQIVDLSDRQGMKIQFMQCGERIGYKPLLSLDIKTGFHYWQTFMDGASDKELASAIVVAQLVWKQGEDLKTIRQIEKQEKIITDLQQKLRECEKRKQS